mgnify:CR=1 FL=1|tara:strand:+ start:476 stop:715 length:240 start_codon:yes stop_codon:yes gene_type:complete
MTGEKAWLNAYTREAQVQKSVEQSREIRGGAALSLTAAQRQSLPDVGETQLELVERYLQSDEHPGLVGGPRSSDWEPGF